MIYPDVTEKLVCEALEALAKVTGGKGSRLTKLERSTLAVLHKQAETLREFYDSIESASAAPLDKALRINRQMQAYEHDAKRLRERRNEAVNAALESGVTAYRVAKELGVTEQAVYKIRDRS